MPICIISLLFIFLQQSSRTMSCKNPFTNTPIMQKHHQNTNPTHNTLTKPLPFNPLHSQPVQRHNFPHIQQGVNIFAHLHSNTIPTSIIATTTTPQPQRQPTPTLTPKPIQPFYGQSTFVQALNYNQAPTEYRRKKKYYIEKRIIQDIVKKQLQDYMKRLDFHYSTEHVKSNLTICPTTAIKLQPPEKEPSSQPLPDAYNTQTTIDSAQNPTVKPQVHSSNATLPQVKVSKSEKRKRNKEKKKEKNEKESTASCSEKNEQECRQKLLKELNQLVETLPERWRNDYKRQYSGRMKQWDSFNPTNELRILQLDIQDYHLQIQTQDDYRNPYIDDSTSEYDRSELF